MLILLLSRTEQRAYVLPSGIFLVFFRYEEPDELGIAHPAFSLHGVTPGNKRQSHPHSTLPLC